VQWLLLSFMKQAGTISCHESWQRRLFFVCLGQEQICSVKPWYQQHACIQHGTADLNATM
jgi:hypothetical protein